MTAAALSHLSVLESHAHARTHTRTKVNRAQPNTDRLAFTNRETHT